MYHRDGYRAKDAQTPTFAQRVGHDKGASPLDPIQIRALNHPIKVKYIIKTRLR